MENVKLVNVNGYTMSVYSKKNRGKTLVFLSGSGTASPILDFKTLFSRLDKNFQLLL